MSQVPQVEPVESSIESLAERENRLRKYYDNFAGTAIWIILLVLVIVSALVSPAFLRTRNITNILKQAAPLGVLGVGQTFVILTGGIDLSVASVMALMSVLSAGMMAGQNEKVLPITLFCLAVATLIGLANGLMVTKLKIPAFIATLGTILIIQGIRFLYTGGAPKGSIPEGLRFWGRGSIGSIPTALVLWLIIVAIMLIVERRTIFGRRLYAVGGNPSASNLSGVNVDQVKIAAYVLCSFFAGVAGLMLTGYIGLADNWLGRGYDLNSIAAVVIGGTVFEGGKGSVLGTVAGVLILTILYNLVLLLALDEETRRIVNGLAIIIAVAMYVRLRARN